MAETIEQSYDFDVAMSCSSCSKAVERVLNKTTGVNKFNVNLDKQLVSVTGTADEECIYQAIKKTGKATKKLGRTPL